jgi:hypothetical protein
MNNETAGLQPSNGGNAQPNDSVITERVTEFVNRILTPLEARMKEKAKAKGRSFDEAEIVTANPANLSKRYRLGIGDREVQVDFFRDGNNVILKILYGLDKLTPFVKSYALGDPALNIDKVEREIEDGIADVMSHR